MNTPESTTPATGTVVVTTFNCEVVLDALGFYVKCGARNCCYVSPYTASKSVARRWANQHDEDTGKEPRA